MPDMPPDKLLLDAPDALDETDQEELVADAQVAPLWQQGVDARLKAREDRIDIVRRLMIRGYSTPRELREGMLQIAPELANVTDRTLMRYKNMIRNRAVEELEKRGGTTHTLDELLIQLSESAKAVTEEMWKLYYNKKTPPATKAGVLRSIHEVEDRFIERLQKLGIVEEAAQRIQYLDKDGKPTDPNTTNVVQMNQDFNAFIRSKYQEPIPSQIIEGKAE